MKFKKIISAAVTAAMVSGMAVSAGAVSQPFAPGSGHSELFRIPALITLKSGRILAAADARYGNGSDSPANIDTLTGYSDDNGETWSEMQVINNFTDVENENDVTRVESSASFIDSAVVEDSNGRVYIVTDALPAYMGNLYAGKSKGGYIDGRFVLCDRTTTEGIESTDLDKEHYPYYIGDYENGYAPVLKFSDGTNYKGYYVDKEYNLFEMKNGAPEAVKVPVIGADGRLTDRQTDANVFYAYSPVKIYPAFYMWLRTSDDGGETWSDPSILNMDLDISGFTGVCPGRGFVYNMNGKERVMFNIYDNNSGTEYTSTVYTEDGGRTWHRGEKAKKVGLAGKSSESQIVELYGGVLRMYSRNTAKHISFCDSTDGGQTWSKYKLDTSLKYTSNCMVSFINYSGLIDGKKAIIAAYPTTAKRKLGAIKIGLYGEDNKVDWKYSYNVTDNLEDLTYVYSCLTELPDGRIALLYENEAAAITYKVFELDELTVHQKQPGALKRLWLRFIALFK